MLWPPRVSNACHQELLAKDREDERKQENEDRQARDCGRGVVPVQAFSLVLQIWEYGAPFLDGMSDGLPVSWDRQMNGRRPQHGVSDARKWQAYAHVLAECHMRKGLSLW